MTKKTDREPEPMEPTDADAIAAITAMQADYDKAWEQYERANERAKILKKAAEELAENLFAFCRKLNERMPLYDPAVTPPSQPVQAAARSLPKPG